MKKKFQVITCCLYIILLSSLSHHSSVASEPIASLVFKTTDGSVRPDYGLFIALYLRDIGIEVDVKIEEWAVFLGTLILRHMYTEEGSLNIFQLSKDSPYCDLSETMQEEGMLLTDLETRQQHYYEWEQLMMDKIIPMLPLYSPKAYEVTWANTKGYDANWVSAKRINNSKEKRIAYDITI